jgi:hypothetical protein
MADLANPCRGQALPASPKIDADVGLAQTEPRRLGCVGDHVTHAPEYRPVRYEIEGERMPIS